jgi:hypothetical protein
VVFSTGSIACSAAPLVTASITASKVGQGSASSCGRAAWQAWCE